MIIVNIVGGLGNQMFQYAYARMLAEKGLEVKIDIRDFNEYTLHGGYFLDRYNITLKVAAQDDLQPFFNPGIISRFLRKMGGKKPEFKWERSLNYSRDFLTVNDHTYLKGYFQSENYFKHIREILITEFSIKEEVSAFFKETESRIHDLGTTCSVHIRRGDYVNDPTTNQVHGTCDLDYYQRAMDLVRGKSDGLKFLMFSDDIPWVKEHISGPDILYVEGPENNIPHEDMALMSKCKHNIIANSSFSWWGGWLNQAPGKIVISPARWFADPAKESQSGDIRPGSWMKL